jgi:aspartyl-tRNA(Asn)/glutamyl-tRNA(Gln) amidotransferase subunit B
MNLINGWEVVIGLEIHAQISSASKLFSGSATSGDGGPNSRVNFFDAGMPGTLPVVNAKCIDLAIKTGLGLLGTINEVSIFDRKNYFYPDLPNGYQISQFFYPIVSGGYVETTEEDETKRVGITRIHLEQDAGKSLHDIDNNKSCIDLNRSGIALMEIVTEPDIRSVGQAVSVAKKIHSLVQYLETCDGNMELGNFRIDSNISLHRPNTELGTRVEIKNLNSFKFMQTALQYEITRQMEVLESGGKVTQETRLFDTTSGETRTMRDKENADDYRYFPDPDLPPLILTQERIAAIKKSLPELPDEKKRRFIRDFGLSEYDARILTADRKIGEFYDAAVLFPEFKDKQKAYKLTANWIIGDLFASMKENGISIDQTLIVPISLAKLVALIEDGTISGKIAKTVFEKMWNGEYGGDPSEIVAACGLKQISSVDEILPVIKKIIADNQNVASEYVAGKESVFGFFVGQVIKHFKGNANPEIVNKLLKQELAAIKNRC